jgi:hypothetical protein
MARDVIRGACDEMRARADELRTRVEEIQEAPRITREDVENHRFGLFASGMAYGFKIAAELIEDAARAPRGGAPVRIREVLDLEPTLRYLAARFSPSEGGGEGEAAQDAS